MKNTSIQWCHSTINPVMGCDGCELWPTPTKVIANILAKIPTDTDLPANVLKSIVRQAIGDRETSEIYTDRKFIAHSICTAIPKLVQNTIVDVIRKSAKCYAGQQGIFRAGHKGYANRFEIPKMFPGRMAEAARWKPPTEADIADSPWLRDLPRLIFISDMGDALSKGISFDYLQQEIIENVSSPSGQRHIWLWLTKRPGRMAEFARWLADQNVSWPDNLMAMTTVTAQRYDTRIDDLRRVPSSMRGLSIEPLFEPVTLDLTGIDWVIVGGGSDVLAEPFHIEWVLDLQEQCRAAGVAFFFKQVGKNPFFRGQSIDLADRHGGDWSEWPTEWRIREFPACLYHHTQPVYATSELAPI